MSYPPGFAPNAQAYAQQEQDVSFLGGLSQEEVEKKSRKWRQTQKKRFSEKRRSGGGGGIDGGKVVSNCDCVMTGLTALCRIFPQVGSSGDRRQ